MENTDRQRNEFGQFLKGCGPNKTSFKKGKHVGEKHPKWKGGVTLYTKDCAYVHIGCGKRARRPKVVWEQHNGPLPVGYCIWHIDGDKHNDEIENLEIVTRAEMLKRNNPKVNV